MLLTETSTVYPLLHAGHIALVAGPAGLDLGDTDRDLTPAEVDYQLSILLRLTPTQAVLLAQELFDCAAATLTIRRSRRSAPRSPLTTRERTPR